MEGKETRFGIAASALFATVTTDASCGAVNSMHDSYTPLGGMVPLVNMMCDETIFGGVGAGLYGMLMYAVVAVFIAGLMVGPHAGVRRQEDREVRGADGHPGGAHPVRERRVLDGPGGEPEPAAGRRVPDLHRRAEGRRAEVARLASDGLLEPRQQQQPEPLLRRDLQQRQQRRRARLHGDPLRLRLPDRQQRLRLRRPHRQHAVLQPHRWARHARSAASS